MLCKPEPEFEMYSDNQLPFVFGNTIVDQNWKQITLNRTFSNPVVILSDPTSNGTAPVTARLRNVSSNTFDVKLQSPSNESSESITAETIYYIVGEQGSWALNEFFNLQVNPSLFIFHLKELLTNLTLFRSFPQSLVHLQLIVYH